MYWTNIGLEPGGLFGDLESTIKQPKDKGMLLKNILETEVDEKYFLSNKATEGILQHKKNKRKRFWFWGCNKNENEKMNALKVGGSGVDDLVVHNTMPRSSTTGKGGTGHLSRNDGKTYCLDTGNTNAVELRKVKQLSTNNKSNGGIQPYQQDRIYDINGISPALQGQLCTGSIMINTSRIRRLTPMECERLQTVKDNYTNHVSDSQRYKMLGNGWTVDVIAHIFKK